VCVDCATPSAGPAPGAGCARPGGRPADALTRLGPRAQLGLAAASPAFLVAPEPGTVFATATLVADTINTSELANGPAVGTRADVICAPPAPWAALLGAAGRPRAPACPGAARRLRTPCTPPVLNRNASCAATAAPLTRGCSCARRRHPDRQAMTPRLGSRPGDRVRAGERSARRLGRCAACAHSVYSSGRGCAGRPRPHD
jgi:hypothetical protein